MMSAGLQMNRLGVGDVVSCPSCHRLVTLVGAKDYPLLAQHKQAPKGEWCAASNSTLATAREIVPRGGR